MYGAPSVAILGTIVEEVAVLTVHRWTLLHPPEEVRQWQGQGVGQGWVKLGGGGMGGWKGCRRGGSGGDGTHRILSPLWEAPIPYPLPHLVPPSQLAKV